MNALKFPGAYIASSIVQSYCDSLCSTAISLRPSVAHWANIDDVRVRCDQRPIRGGHITQQHTQHSVKLAKMPNSSYHTTALIKLTGNKAKE